MQMILENSDILNSVKEISKELELDKELDGMKSQLGKIVTNTIDKVATYTIKAMPIPDGFKDVLCDVKEAFKTKDFKEIITTVIDSSIREGLEILGLDKSSIKSLKEIKEIATKGGLIHGIKAGVEIVAKKYLKSNIVGNYIYDFFDKLKDSPFTNDFEHKMESSINKISEAKDEFLSKCNEFKEAYENLNIEKLTTLASEVQEAFKSVKLDKECIRKNKTIQNIFALVSNSNSKLTDAQLQLCNMM